MSTTTSATVAYSGSRRAARARSAPTGSGPRSLRWAASSRRSAATSGETRSQATKWPPSAARHEGISTVLAAAPTTDGSGAASAVRSCRHSRSWSVSTPRSRASSAAFSPSVVVRTRSLSTSGRPVAALRSVPIVVLPAPIEPTSTRCRGGFMPERRGRGLIPAGWGRGRAQPRDPDRRDRRRAAAGAVPRQPGQHPPWPRDRPPVAGAPVDHLRPHLQGLAGAHVGPGPVDAAVLLG